MKRREAKSKGEKARYKHLNAELQRLAKRDKKAFLGDQCKETEENNRTGTTEWTKRGPPEKGMAKTLQYSCLENSMNSMKRQKERTLKDEPSKSAGAQYATGEQWRNNSRKNEEMEPKQKQHLIVNVTSDGSKV